VDEETRGVQAEADLNTAKGEGKPQRVEILRHLFVVASKKSACGR
jgi:hypothetical protein